MGKQDHQKLPEGTREFFDHVEQQHVNKGATLIIGHPGQPSSAQVKTVSIDRDEKKIVVEPTNGSYHNLKKQLVNETPKVTIYVDRSPFASKCTRTATDEKTCTLYF